MLKGIAKAKQKTYKIADKLPPVGLVKISLFQNSSGANLSAIVLIA